MIITIILQSQFSFSQGDIKFKRLSIGQGLSQSTVETIVQDQMGFMWFGTEDGLNRYDGYQFKIFKHDPDDPNSISNNNIWCLFVDSNGFLWVGTYTGGLNRFDPKTETFTRYLHNPADQYSLSSNRIRSITEDKHGNLWIGTRDGGLNYLDIKSGQSQRYIHDPKKPNSLCSNNIRFVYPDSGNVLWIATNKGLSIYEIDNDQFTYYHVVKNSSNSLSHNSIRHIFKDQSGILWMSTVKGLNSFNPQTKQFTNYLHNSGNPGSIGSDNIRKVYEDRKGRLWIATGNNGLIFFDRKNNTFYSYLNDPTNFNSISNNNVRIITEDWSGLLWFGTLGGGLNIYNPKTDLFKHYRHDSQNSNSLGYPIIWAISQGPDGDLWFGSNAGGVDRYNKKTGKYISYKHDEKKPYSLSDDHIRTLLWDSKGILWIGSRYTGVDYYDGKSGQFFNIPHDPDNPNSLCHNNIRYIYEDRTENLWFCSWGGGLDLYNRESKIFKNFSNDPDNPNSLSSNNVISIFQDKENNYWITTSNGLNRLSFSEDITTPSHSKPDFTRFFHEPDNPESISNSYVLSIHEAQNGDLWFGTMLGLSRLKKEDRNNPTFTRYFIKNGLPNDVVYGILEDDEGNLWLSTNNGISRFNVQSETFKNYDISDGLQSNEFNTGAYFQTKVGSFIFGGVNGANEFYPDSLKDSPYVSPVVLTSFNIFDQPARLPKAISGIEEITLSYRDNYFSFEFASMDFTKPDRNQYAYMLEGLDKSWIKSGTRHFAGYTKLDGGEYIFKVKGTNGDGVWNEEPTAVKIIITPPFWKTWWFIILLILTIGGGVSFFITYRIKQLLAIERLRSKIAANLHDDIGAGLTEISIIGEVISQKLQPKEKQHVKRELTEIGETSRNLIDSMSDIVWLVNPRRDSLFDLISRLGDSYKELLNSQNINFKTQNLEILKNVRLKMEYRQQIFLIFKEAINNSLKYSQSEEIFLKATLKGRKLKMQLIDDGTGFDIKKLPKGNGLINMIDRAKNIGGTLTIKSEIGKGTEIEFSGNI